MKFDIDDTIAAISTSTGQGGIGIVRLSGPMALTIADSIFFSPKGKVPSRMDTFTMAYGYIRDPVSDDNWMDEVLISVMRSPHTYTRQDMVEINCHGGIFVQRKALEAVIGLGARLARPGEFTMRAYLNGRIDLAQAEAVCDLINAVTDGSSSAASQQLNGRLSIAIHDIKDDLIALAAAIELEIDFNEEDIVREGLTAIKVGLKAAISDMTKLVESYETGRFYRDGMTVAIIGTSNAGKSSLLNSLTERDRAIVTDIPGTTRDTIEETVNIGGIAVRLIDTAGIREIGTAKTDADIIELEGMHRTFALIESSDIVIALFDGNRPLSDSDIDIIKKTLGKKTIYAVNKSDLPPAFDDSEITSIISSQNGDKGLRLARLSAVTRDGLDGLKAAIFNAAGCRPAQSEGLIITNLRHKMALCDALENSIRCLNSIDDGTPLEIAAIELAIAIGALSLITGETFSDDILNVIFDNFCIGK